MFYQFDLNLDTNIFDEFENSIKFELITKGRFGANCFIEYEQNVIPLVRTTSIYYNPIQKFPNSCNFILHQIKSQALTHNIDISKLNNGLVEIYTYEYKTMSFHSDQALDLEQDSWICIFSSYSNPELISSTRKLIIQSKLNKECFEYNLRHNSVIMFNTNTNNEHIHRIVLSNLNSKPDDNKWLGITFRTSKTLIKFIDKKPYISNNMDELVLASEEEKKQFYMLRSQENKLSNFNYPYINYTISPSDLINPF